MTALLSSVQMTGNTDSATLPMTLKSAFIRFAEPFDLYWCIHTPSLRGILIQGAANPKTRGVPGKMGNRGNAFTHPRIHVSTHQRINAFTHQHKSRPVQAIPTGGGERTESTQMTLSTDREFSFDYDQDGVDLA